MIVYTSSEPAATSKITPSIPALGDLASRAGDEAGRRAVSGPLGTTYEITQANFSKPNKFNHIEKFVLKSVARHILPGERVSKCLRMVIASTVDIWWHLENQRAHFKGLAVCGSVWFCPVCAAKITERRRVELSMAIARSEHVDLIPYMLTLTVRHHKQQSLSLILERFGKARRTMLNREQWKSWAKRIRLEGSVRSLEVTHGENGWHVHTHEILFCRFGEEPRAQDILSAWQKACVDSGLECPDVHGVDIKTGDEEIGNYISKWGMDAELTKSMSKRGRNGNRSPWDFLRDYFTGGDEADADLFRAYAKAFKHKRQLVWSDGLRDLLGLKVECSDHELAEEIENGSVLLGSLSVKQWRTIIKFNKEGEVLHLALSGIEAVNGYVEYLESL